MKKINRFTLSVIALTFGCCLQASTNNYSSTLRSSSSMSSAQINQTEGDAFLAANKTKPGVVTLPSGLQYKILHEGHGVHPTKSDTVIVNYAGTLINGTEFDSSYKRGQPISFPVGAVIAGWVEALPLMPVGSTWELYIPANLAYGQRGAPPSIGPNATLIFKVELIGIEK